MGTGIGLIFYWENGIGTTGTGICDTKFTAGNGIQLTFGLQNWDMHKY